MPLPARCFASVLPRQSFFAHRPTFVAERSRLPLAVSKFTSFARGFTQTAVSFVKLDRRQFLLKFAQTVAVSKGEDSLRSEFSKSQHLLDEHALEAVINVALEPKWDKDEQFIYEEILIMDAIQVLCKLAYEAKKDIPFAEEFIAAAMRLYLWNFDNVFYNPALDKYRQEHLYEKKEKYASFQKAYLEGNMFLIVALQNFLSQDTEKRASWIQWLQLELVNCWNRSVKISGDDAKQRALSHMNLAFAYFDFVPHEKVFLHKAFLHCENALSELEPSSDLVFVVKKLKGSICSCLALSQFLEKETEPEDIKSIFSSQKLKDFFASSFLERKRDAEAPDGDPRKINKLDSKTPDDWNDMAIEELNSCVPHFLDVHSKEKSNNSALSLVHIYTLLHGLYLHRKKGSSEENQVLALKMAFTVEQLRNGEFNIV